MKRIKFKLSLSFLSILLAMRSIASQTPHLFYLYCYIPSTNSIVYRYLKISTPIFGNQTSLQMFLMPNTSIEDDRKVDFRFPKISKQVYRHCSIEPIAKMLGDASNMTVIANNTALKELPAIEKSDFDFDSERINLITEDQINQQIADLKTLFENELKFQAFPELLKTR